MLLVTLISGRRWVPPSLSGDCFPPVLMVDRVFFEIPRRKSFWVICGYMLTCAPPMDSSSNYNRGLILIKLTFLKVNLLVVIISCCWLLPLSVLDP